MNLVLEARRVLDAMPPRVREGLESTAAFLPRALAYGGTFRRTRSLIASTERGSEAELRALQDAKVRALVAYAYERTPYYRRVMDERGVEPRHVRGVDDLVLLPLLTKDLVRRHEDELLAAGVPARAREQVATGGTSGEPFRFWIDRDRSAIEWAFMTWQWQAAGYRLGARRAVLRGAVVRGGERGRVHEWHPLLDEVVVSTFHLSPETLPSYLAALERYRPLFLHAYPSSAENLARLLAEAGREPPRFRALLLGSENLYPEQRAFLERFYGCRAFAWYGHSEKCLLGGGCERSEDYHLFPQYGVLEVIDASGRRVERGGEGTLVGTGFLNRAMPFLRYATDDRATLVAEPCACGRAYPRLRNIEGRWQERLYGHRGVSFSMVALNSHSSVFDRVRRFQIRQDSVGEARVLVVPGPGYAPSDGAAILREYATKTGGAIRFDLEVVASLPLTGRGKFKFIDQRLEADTNRRGDGLGGRGTAEQTAEMSGAIRSRENA